MENKFVELALKRQSCREFSNKKIEKEVLDKILDTALLAPSACNSQPWKLVAVTEEDKCNAVRECLTVNGHNKFLKDVTTFVACVECEAVLKAGVESRFDRNRFVKYDVGQLIAYLTLGASAEGVESCIIGWMDEQRLKNELNLADNEFCKIVVALGYSNIETRKKSRKERTITVKYM